MWQFTKILLTVGFLIVFVSIYYASVKGFGIAGLHNKNITEEMRGERGASYFIGSTGRSIRGGGMRSGK